MGYENSGRRPQPTALKMLRGNPSKTRPNILEPKTPPGEPAKPEGLSAGAAQVWDEIAPVLLYMGTLTLGDAPTFATLCELQATLRMASAQKSAEGFAPFTLGEDYNGVPKVHVHAAIKLERETATAIRPYYDYFGMTPSSRARLTVPKQEEAPVSKWAGALK
jgi:P27 family predicted phage terminase small subunit